MKQKIASELKIIRYEREYSDGTVEKLEGIDCDNYTNNLAIADGICSTRSYIKFKPVSWKTVNNVVQEVEKWIKAAEDTMESERKAGHVGGDDWFLASDRVRILKMVLQLL